MKKYLYSMLAMATMLFAASCTQEDDFNANVEGADVEATFTIDLPAEMGTRAIGDGTTVDVVACAVYDEDDIELKDLRINDLALSGKKATYKVRLAKGQKYRVAFFAYKKDAGAYDIADLKEIKVLDSQLSNREDRDAFTAYVDITPEESMNPINKTVYLKRPFAQLNLGSLFEDIEAARKSGIVVTDTKITVTNVYTAFSAFDNEVVGDTATRVFGYNDQPSEDLKANGGKYDYLALNYLLVGDLNSTKSLHKVTFEWLAESGKVNDPVTVWDNVPMQRNYRTNIIGYLLTNPAEFNIIVDEQFEEPDHDFEVVENDLQFEAAIRANEEHIVINLIGEDNVSTRAAVSREYTLNVDAWVEKYYLGGSKTKTITVNGNGATINFVQNNGDWNYVRIANDDAKLILNDVNITNSGKNSGHWKRSLIRFYNEVEFNNVNSDKGICLMNDAQLKNIDINVADENYSVWLTAQGQTVTIDGLDVVATNKGRGIKIGDEDYENSAAKVVLNVKNAKFQTAKKAAILVSSVAGAEINLEKIDLSGVKADGINAVWVDEEWIDYADKVTVNGGFVANEPASGAAENPFMVEGATVELPAGTYTFPSNVAKGVTINCEEGTVFAGTTGLNINGSKVVGATFSNPGGKVVGGTINGSFEDCTFIGDNAFRYCYAGETTYFKDCVIDGAVYGVHFDGGENPVTFENCTLSGFNAFGSAITELTFDGCTFKATGRSGYNGANLWGKTVIKNTTFDFDGTASTEWIGLNAAVADKSMISFENCTVKNGSLMDYFANYDNGDLVTIDGDVVAVVEDADALVAALEGKNGAVLMEDVNINPAGMSNAYGTTGINVKYGQTVDGNGNVLDIKGAGGTWDSGINTTGGLIKNITVTGSFRGIFVNHNSEHAEKVVLENVIIDGTVYTISCDQGNGQGLEAKNSTFNGWTSYAATLGDAKFVDCNFGEGSGYAYCRPYAPTEFVGCNFEAGFRMDARAAVTFENCTLGGVELTSENIGTLVVSNVANATVK